MPRTARRDAPGLVHHVMLRGIERGLVFRDDRDRADLLRRLAEVLLATGVACFAFAFMPNHVHLVLQTGSIPIARAMARIATGYVVRFNARHARAGHLFQNRYKAVLVDSDEQLRILVRYVHLNPLRACLVPGLAALEAYPWTGYAALMGRADVPFLHSRAILALFGASPEEGRRALREWMAAAPPVLPPDETPLARLPSLARLIDAVAQELGVSPSEIALGGRRREACRARAVVAHLACDVLGVAEADVATRVGVGGGALASAKERGRELMRDAPESLTRLLARSVPKVGDS